jgi:hypothetical protein
MDGKEMLQKHVVVEGHRDVYEQIYRTSVGEKAQNAKNLEQV